LDNDTAFKSKHASRWEELFGKLVKHTLEGDMYTASKIFVATIVKPATQLSELRNELIDRGIDMASCVKKQMEVFDDQVDEIGAISQHNLKDTSKVLSGIYNRVSDIKKDTNCLLLHSDRNFQQMEEWKSTTEMPMLCEKSCAKAVVSPPVMTPVTTKIGSSSSSLASNTETQPPPPQVPQPSIKKVVRPIPQSLLNPKKVNTTYYHIILYY